jgi:TonB-dependent SusC/RagA subfamily outer membrane receptor
MKKRRFFISILVLVVFLSSAYTILQDQNSRLLTDLKFKLEAHYNWYPQQKAYLHIDKSHYFVDETVWFKAYLVDASKHWPDEKSTNLYVDLINPSGYIVQTRLLKLKHGMAKGDFSFNDTIPEGNYTIKAYTNWMKNLGPAFFFSEEIYITNPNFKTYATRDAVIAVKKSVRKNARKENLYDVSFLPEGGNLLSGVSNRVAFKAINDLGKSIEIEGKLLGKRNEVVLSFSSTHLGMGFFEFTPEKGVKYKAIINSEGLKQETFRLPESIDEGVSMKIDNSNPDSIKVLIISNLYNNLPPNTIYYIFAHTRGILGFADEIDLKDSKREILIPKSAFPSGVMHITLFNYRSSAIAERLVYIDHKDAMQISISTSKTQYDKREKAVVKIKVNDPDEKPLIANLSLSITPSNNLRKQGDIYSNFLLSSDLSGNIENPEYYFKNNSKKAVADLDILMMTQGWRRFDWPTVVLNQKIQANFPYEKGIEISGKITREFFGIPLRDIKVDLSMLDEYNDVFSTRSDYYGNFEFTNLEYYDTLSVRIEAAKSNGKKNLLILLSEKERERLKSINYQTTQILKKPGAEGRYKNFEEEKPFDPFEKENNSISRLHQEPNSVIILDETMRQYSNIAQVIQGRVPGVMVNGTDIIIRGRNTFYGSTDPLFIMDGVPVEKGTVMSIPPTDIERIEILKGSEAAIYGSRGANGVIAVYTRRGKFMIKGVIDFKMLGYYAPREFYSPKYVNENRDSFMDDRTTLFWEPDIVSNIEGEKEVEFYTSDISGEYLIQVEGMTTKGQIGVGKTFMEIK